MIYPQAMRQPFTSEEISDATKKLRNGRSVGIDEVADELLKYGPEILYEEIAIIFNTLALYAPFKNQRRQKGPLITYAQ